MFWGQDGVSVCDAWGQAARIRGGDEDYVIGVLDCPPRLKRGSSCTFQHPGVHRTHCRTRFYRTFVDYDL